MYIASTFVFAYRNSLPWYIYWVFSSYLQDFVFFRNDKSVRNTMKVVERFSNNRVV